MQVISYRTLLIAGWLGLLFLAGCQSAAAPAAPAGADQTTPAAAEAPLAEATDTSSPVAGPTMMATVSAEPSLAEAAEAAQPKPEIKAELEATDPGTVKLASGKVQLVEFFAFW